MAGSNKKHPSLAAFVQQMAKLLRTKAPRLKKVERLDETSSSAKIEQIARLLRDQVHPEKKKRD